MYKKIAALLLAMSMVFALTACGSNEESDTTDQDNTTSVTDESAAPEENPDATEQTDDTAEPADDAAEPAGETEEPATSMPVQDDMEVSLGENLEGAW